MKTIYNLFFALSVVLSTVHNLNADSTQVSFEDDHFQWHPIYLESFENSSSCQGYLPAETEFKEDSDEDGWYARWYTCHYNGWKYTIGVINEEYPETAQELKDCWEKWDEEGFSDKSQEMMDALIRMNAKNLHCGRYEIVSEKLPHVRYALDEKRFCNIVTTLYYKTNEIKIDLLGYYQERTIVTDRGTVYFISARLDDAPERFKGLQDPWSFQTPEEQQVWKQILQSIEVIDQ